MGKWTAPEYWLCEGDPPTTSQVSADVNTAYIAAKQQVNMDVYIAIEGGGIVLVSRKPMPLTGLWHIGGAFSFGDGVSSLADIAIATLMRETTLTRDDVLAVAQPRVRFHKTRERPNKDVNIDQIVWVDASILREMRVKNEAKYESYICFCQSKAIFDDALHDQGLMDSLNGIDPEYRRVALETVWHDVHAGAYLVW